MHFEILIEDQSSKTALDIIVPKIIGESHTLLLSYTNDSICGTWEKLADAVYPGGARALSAKGWQAVGVEKSKWAKKKSPNMDTEKNLSPSFCYFRGKMKELAGV